MEIDRKHIKFSKKGSTTNKVEFSNWRIAKPVDNLNKNQDNQIKSFNSPTNNWREAKTNSKKASSSVNKTLKKTSNEEKYLKKEINYKKGLKIVQDTTQIQKNTNQKSVFNKDKLSNVNDNVHLSDTPNNATSDRKLTKSIDSSTLTEEEMKILYDEPLNTTNPLKAVMGYVPKDDKAICKFAVNGECFKKGKCLLSHERKLSNGWTKDKSDVITSNINEPIHPPNDTSIQIIITSIEKCGYKFYGQMLSPDLEIFYDLMNELNSPDEIINYKTYPNDLIPTLSELVLAKYSDGLFYRGQIIEYFEDTNDLSVFFVDYGNTDTVALENIRKWNRKYEILSFQAIHFTLYGITCNLEKQSTCKNILEEILLNQIFDAKVVDNFDSTYIQIFDNDQTDIGNKLLKFDLWEENYIFDTLFNKECLIIPG